MRRLHLFEFEDQPGFPATIRDCMTEYLSHVVNLFNFYESIVPILQKGEAGRLSNVHFRKGEIPLDSGSIESSIRRVINNRMKGNGMFWRRDNAEAMLQLRCLVMSDRWDESFASMRNMNRKTSHKDWRWVPSPMNPKVEANKQDDQKPKNSQGKS